MTRFGRPGIRTRLASDHKPLDWIVRTYAEDGARPPLAFDAVTGHNGLRLTVGRQLQRTA
jgi:hypothetical protein